MPRTIEGLVESHRAARFRIAAGRSPWDRKINIKTILHSDPGNTSEEHAAFVANQIAVRLRQCLSSVLLDWNSPDVDSTLLEIVESLEELRPDSYVGEDDYSALQDLNNRLDELYDWADRERVWLGG